MYAEHIPPKWDSLTGGSKRRDAAGVCLHFQTFFFLYIRYSTPTQHPAIFHPHFHRNYHRKPPQTGMFS